MTGFAQRVLLACALSLMGTILPVAASAADTDWNGILVLDSGPKSHPSSREEAMLLARNHFLIQKRALLDFLKKYPNDPRAADAGIRYAVILAAEGKMDANTHKLKEALMRLSGVENNPQTLPGLRANAGFQRASLLMQSAPGGPELGYLKVVDAAEDFCAKYPDDIRSARLLVEAATVCDSAPETKRALLNKAKSQTSEPLLQDRIADDLARLDRLDTPLELTMPALNGGKVDLAKLRGKPVLVVFWASTAPQSLLWLRDLRQDWDALPEGALAVVTINMDADTSAAAERAREFHAPWLVGHEPGGWESPTARRLGINALPTVWFIDRSGVLRSLNAKSTWREMLAKSRQ